ncbi:MAG TPA: DUF4886 domain-containing protein [Paludibacteraceae bacterium]|nr:DUF4886 domain-containing protein [Paludibacteraceae bacterium]
MNKKFYFLLFTVIWLSECLPFPLNAAKLQKEPIKILAIGNSFSDDAVEYLDELAIADSVPLIVGNLYIGGCSLERHWKNATELLPDYSYRKSNLGIFTNQDHKTLLDGLLDENWDIVVVQQVSQLSGKYDTYFPYLPNLMRFVKTHAKNPKVKFALHQVWAYAQNSTHEGFANYDRDQMKMYLAITETVKKVAATTGIKIIIPSGTAIQNCRTSEIGDHLNRDGYHLDLHIGRYVAACTWFETFFHRSCVGNPFKPAGVTDRQAKIAQYAAHYAIQRPFEITSMKNFAWTFSPSSEKTISEFLVY